MKKQTLETIDRTYRNNGQHAEQTFRYTLTHEIKKADNIPFTDSADIDDIQVKSARATICKGTDIESHLQKDKAQRYAYITADFKTAYIMTKAEYKEFATEFGTVTADSKQNGGQIKTRFKHETQRMIEWLTQRV